MVGRLTGALTRALLVAFVIAFPALLLPASMTQNSEIIVFVAILSAVMTFIEYNSEYPSIVEFRDAPPFNRLRFGTLAITVFFLTVVNGMATSESALTQWLLSVGSSIGQAIDFPYSPVRLVVLMLPPEASVTLVDAVRSSAGIAYMVSLVALIAFIVLVRVFHWPARQGAFNVWVNLPLFDPTAGGDVIQRLQRDARINVALGFLLPFVIPAIVKAASDLVDPVTLQNPQTLIWTMTAWAFLPASMIMRGVAIARLAEMIEKKRQRAYSEALQTA